MEKIRTGRDFRGEEIEGVIRAMIEHRFVVFNRPDATDVAPGQFARLNRIFKGAENTHRAEELQTIETPARFYPVGGHHGHEWHELEQHDVHGSFRWSGPSPVSSIVIPVQRDRALRFAIHAIAAIDPAALETLQIEIDDARVAHEVEMSENGTWLLRGTIDPLDEADDGTLITLRTDRTRQPFNIGLNQDRRWLGIAVAWVEVSPAD
jgi:hypothetical protein